MLFFAGRTKSCLLTLILFGGACLLLPGCAGVTPATTHAATPISSIEDPAVKAALKKDPTFFIWQTDDAEMHRAIAMARQRVGTFIAALRAAKPGQVEFIVKKRFVEGDQAEHLWLRDVHFNGLIFCGKVENVPAFLHNVKLGDRATVAPADISDWEFTDNGRLIGGYTVTLMTDRFDRWNLQRAGKKK